MKTKSFLPIFLAVLGLTACKEDFLDRKPQTSLTESTFFQTPADLETYSNGFYTFIGATYSDVFSDNIALHTSSSETENVVRGTINASNVGGWDSWGNIRRINLMLDNVKRTTGDAAVIRHYVGIARFFRGMIYYDLVKRYGDVPWYSSVIGAEDAEQLMKPKDPRTLVVDSVMSDLEYAAANIMPTGTNTRITKWAAMNLLARTALHEGTFRKYQSDLNLQNTAQKFLERAASASQAIMTDGGFTISGTDASGFRALFSSGNLDANKEVIFLQKSSQANGIANNSHTVLDYEWSLSRSLSYEFLSADGTPMTAKAGYATATFVDMFTNRDPRMAETFMPPGFSQTPATGVPYLPKPSIGGLVQIKFYPRDPALRGGWVLNYTDLPIYRYAEVLLIHAEAKAELGTLTQDDLDKTVNLLRARVKMPTLTMSAANAGPDSYLASEYPLVTGSNKGVILEIRRERRVELACEGFRYDDLVRWKVGKLLESPGEGLYVPALGALDITGDGIVDIAILEAKGKEEPLAQLPADLKAKVVQYYLSDGTFYLSNGTSGAIRFTKDREQPRQFDEAKSYYRPIPQQQLTLNKNLVQTKGWE